MALTEGELVRIGDAVRATLGSAVAIYEPDDTTDELGELTGEPTLAATVNGRVSRPTTRTPFINGAPLTVGDYVLTLDGDPAGAVSFDVEGVRYYPVGDPAFARDTTGTGVYRLAVRRTSSGTVEAGS